MKKKVLALSLSAVLALSSTSAFAATTNCTNVTKYDFSNLLKNYTSKYAAGNVTYKVTVNGKAVDLNSVNWKELLNNSKPATTAQAAPKATTPVEKPAATTPVEAQKPVAQAPVVQQPVVQQPVQKPVAEQPATPAPAPAPTNTNTSVSSYEQKVVELVNVERQKAGLSALKLDSSMANVARMKSKDMADNNYFAHQSPTYGSAGDMLSKFGIKWSAWGENIASGQKTPEAVVTAWMNSPGHRANILSTNFGRIGVGYVTNSNGTPYWTQMFAN